MSTEVSLVNPQAMIEAAFAGGLNPFVTVAKAEGVTDGIFGRFNGNTGAIIIGDGELDDGTPVIMELIDSKQVWLGFDDDNKPHRGPEVKIITGMPLPEPDRTNKAIRWMKQIVVPLVLMDSGKRVMYSSKAEKPTRPMWKLIKDFGSKVSRNRDPEDGSYHNPIVTMSSRSFEMTIPEQQPDGTTRKIKAKKFAEAFEITGWISNRDVADIVAGGADADAEQEGDDMIDVTPQGVEVAPGVEVLPPAPKEPMKAPAAAAPAAGSGFRRSPRPAARA